MNTSPRPQSYPDPEPSARAGDTTAYGPGPAAHQDEGTRPPQTADRAHEPETPGRPTGPSLPTMVMGLVLLVTAVAVGVIRLTDVAAGPPSWSWVIVVLGGVLVVAGLLGALMGRRDH